MSDQQSAGTAVAFDLSEAELAFLLRAMSLPRLPGFEIPAGLSPDMVATAGHGLRARGLAAVEAGVYRIVDTVAALVACGAVAGQVMTIVHDEDDEPRQLSWFYMSPGLTVYHSSPTADIHRFQTVLDGMTMLLMTAAALNLDREVVTQDNVVFEMPRPLFEDMRDLLDQQAYRKAAKLLGKRGCPDVFVKGLAETFSRSGVSVARQVNGHIEANGCLVLAQPGTYWMLQPVAGIDDIMIEAGGSDVVVAHVASMLV